MDRGLIKYALKKQAILKKQSVDYFKSPMKAVTKGTSPIIKSQEEYKSAKKGIDELTFNFYSEDRKVQNRLKAILKEKVNKRIR